jgi:hypothetical protein
MKVRLLYLQLVHAPNIFLLVSHLASKCILVLDADPKKLLDDVK